MTLREFLDRYGPAAGVVLALALVIALLPSNNDRTELNARGSSSQRDAEAVLGGTESQVDGANVAVGTGGVVGGGAATGGGASTGATTPGPASSGQATVRAGSGKCRADGRQQGISGYMPPCIDFSGDNGGATARGVTRDKVLVIRFVSQVDPATTAILQSANLADDPAVVSRAVQSLTRYSNLHYQTYGRQIEVRDYNASGPDESDEAMKADALKIANDLKAFAVIGGPKIFGQELARRGVICICTVSLSSTFYGEQPPLIFGALPTANEYATHIGEYIGKRVARKPAKYAGNLPVGINTRERKFGLIYIEGARGRVDPEGKRIRDAIVGELRKYGVSLAAEFAYLYDPGRNQNDVSAMIAAMKGNGVTTVLMFADPLYPILITTEATTQSYQPEWFITGSGLSDTTAAGRLYDQQQWRHAFGISPLWVTWTNVAGSPGYREFHHGMPGMKPKDEGVLINIYRSPVQSLFTGIHMAGPKLTTETFAQGMFNYPRTGGLPGAPLVFRTRQFPTEIKDFVEIYYDINARGPDERSQQGSGMIQKVNQGKRYLPGQWPSSPAQVFGDTVNPIAVSDNPPGGKFDPLHEQDGHTHTGRCLSCTG